jgi:uncharacterized protein YbjT (DUF2867 family)
MVIIMKILVTGATGNVGRMVVDELLALGATDVRALTANPAKAALPPQVEVVRGYLGRPETLPRAFEGVDRMYLAPLVETASEAGRLAARAGVGHIVDLAGAKGEHWQAVEDGVEASGVPWTHLEAGEFMANAGLWAPQIIAGDVVRDGYGEAVNAPIAMEDIAAVAARILVDGGHHGVAYELTGPQSLSRRDRVRLIGEALGRELTYVDLPHDQAVAQLELTMGEFGAWYVDGLAQLMKHPQLAVQTVAEITGRPGMTFAQWSRRHAALFG